MLDVLGIGHKPDRCDQELLDDRELLVVAGAAFTALCWPLTWVLRGTFRALLGAPDEKEEVARAA